MRVRWRTARNALCDVSSGIPQGSSLGPLIFGYFVSDLMIKHSEEDTILIKYADDIIFLTNVYEGGSRSMAAEIFEEIKAWTVKNGMLMKQNKCQQMFVTSQKQIDYEKFKIPDIPLKMNLKILGVTFDDKLNWKCHVSGMCRKASSRLFALRQLARFLT